MDCEGCEYEVFPSLTPYISKGTFFAGELHPCKAGHSCAYSKEVIEEVKSDICNSFDNCCVSSKSFGAVACGGMGERQSILGSQRPKIVNLDFLITDNNFLVFMTFVGLVVFALLFKRKQRKGKS
jgi:hypothetical protein